MLSTSFSDTLTYQSVSHCAFATEYPHPHAQNTALRVLLLGVESAKVGQDRVCSGNIDRPLLFRHQPHKEEAVFICGGGVGTRSALGPPPVSFPRIRGVWPARVRADKHSLPRGRRGRGLTRGSSLVANEDCCGFALTGWTSFCRISFQIASPASSPNSPCLQQW